MIADFFTKPLQGKHFRWLRDIVMGLAPFPMEERVGLYDNSPKKSIVEECIPIVHDGRSVGANVVDNCGPCVKKQTWADVVMKSAQRRV